MKPSGSRLPMRCAIAAAAAMPLASCSLPTPNFPAPWEAAENPGAEPNSALVSLPAPRVEWARIGNSIRGKPIHAATIGSGERRIYVIAGIHGDEPEGPAAARAAADLLFASSHQASIRIVRDANPDGSVSRSRTNTRGVDLGRNWPARDWIGGDKLHGARPASELETLALQKDIDAFKPDLVIIIRSTARGPVVTLEGDRSKLAAFEFASGARRADARWRVVPDRWKPEKGSPESYATLNLQKPVLSIELQRGRGAVSDARALQLGLEAIAASTPLPAAAKR
jgi:murein peptide amidase A